jgi:hypothetical protein
MLQLHTYATSHPRCSSVIRLLHSAAARLKQAAHGHKVVVADSHWRVNAVAYDNGDDLRKGSKVSGDPDVLRDLVQQARGVPLDVQHITGSEIKALRTTSQKASKVNVSFTRAIANFFGGIIGGIFSIFAAPVQKKSQCQMYGHVRPSGGWSGPYPKCVECGAAITCEEDLRGSSAKR